MARHLLRDLSPQWFDTHNGYRDPPEPPAVYDHYEDICVDHTLCHFCGEDDTPIHPEAQDQYGEPVCCWCFASSYERDP